MQVAHVFVCLQAGRHSKVCVCMCMLLVRTRVCAYCVMCVSLRYRDIYIPYSAG